MRTRYLDRMDEVLGALGGATIFSTCFLNSPSMLRTGGRQHSPPPIDGMNN